MNIKGENQEKLIKHLYLDEGYIKKIPDLHEFDSPWKLKNIYPFIDKFMEIFQKEELNLLDIGGGAGLILKGVSTYIEKKYSIKVNKYALDLSLESLKILNKRNPDLKRSFKEDIRKTSLKKKEFDLCLMIDVLEHIPKPQIALIELKRITNYAILKVPLEDNLYNRIWNFLKNDERKRESIKDSGHINFYNYFSIKNQIENYLGSILKYHMTDIFKYLTKTPKYYKDMNFRDKLINKISLITFKISPKLTSLLFQDFIMILCECFPN